MRTTLHHPRRSALIALAAGLAIAATVAATAIASSRHATHRPKPTIVLVHGGWADSSSWNEEITRLQRLGYPAIAPANPLRGLGSDAAYVRSVLHTIKGPIVLVGHSYGGAVISNAAVGVANVKALVYIAAFAPDKGESLGQLVTMNPGTGIWTGDTDRPPLSDRERRHRRRSLPDRARVRDRVRRRRPAQAGRPDVGGAAAVLPGRVRVAVQRPGLEDDPVLVPGRHPGSRDPARHRAVHGGTRARHHQAGQGIARGDDLPSRRDDEPDPRSSARRPVSHGAGRTHRAPCRPQPSSRESPRATMREGMMGREGIEPSTLGLGVQSDEFVRTATN